MSLSLVSASTYPAYEQFLGDWRSSLEQAIVRKTRHKRDKRTPIVTVTNRRQVKLPVASVWLLGLSSTLQCDGLEQGQVFYLR